MNVYRISKCNYIRDLTGSGSARYSGRWHNKGTYVLYTAATPSLALLESVVHISRIVIAAYCMVCLNIPEDKITAFLPGDLPGDWYGHPPADHLKTIGDKFISNNKFLGLKLPSAIMPEESNILLNPNHADFSQVRILYERTIPIDERLVKGI